MRPKRRAVVTAAPTTKGMLFRLGEQFLELKGETSWSRFQQVAPFLRGDTSLEQARDRLEPDGYAFLIRIVEALQRAGMVYDAADDLADDIPSTRDARPAETLRRLEAHSTQPRRAFANARRARIVVASDPRGIAPLLEGCAEAGLLPSAIDVTSGRGADAVSPLFTLGVYHDAIVAATLVAGTATGCHDCLDDYYRGAGLAASPVSDQPDQMLERGVRIGARLLVQQMLDFHAGAWPKPLAANLSELDLRTFEIRHRRLFPRQECRRCARLALNIEAAAPLDAPDTESATPLARDAATLWKQAEAFYCDRRTGFITDLAEVRLLQFPSHQSAARRRAAGGLPSSWITDAGHDLYEARLAVLLRAVESSLSERLAAQEDAPNRWSPGVVASGWTAREAQDAALLQVVAQFAQTSLSDWADVSMADLVFSAADDLTLDYFRDVDLLSRVRAQRNVWLSRHGLHVLRFAWDSKLVSIVAGLDCGPIVQTGLRDLWLDRTGLDFFGSAWTATPIRFRSCASASPVSALRAALERVELEPRLQLLDSPLTLGVAPIRFAHAALLRAPRTIVGRTTSQEAGMRL